MKKIKDLFNIVKYQQKNRKLEIKVETLENTIKDELYKEFIAKLSESTENERLKREVKMLRKKQKVLKEIIKEGK